MITIQHIKDNEEFRLLKDEWQELLQNSLTNNLFLTWDWLYLWWQHLREDRKLRLITVRLDGLLIAIAPLAVRPSRYKRLIPFKVLEFLGGGYVGSDYLNIITRKEYENIALQAVADNLSQDRLALELSQIERSTHPVIEVARRLENMGWQPEQQTIDFCPYISLSDHTWESYLAGLSRSHRKNIRNKLKKLHNLFDVRIEQARTEEQRKMGLNMLFTLHHKRWEDRGESNAFNKPELLEFHQQFTKAALANGNLRLFVMWLDDTPAAAVYGFSYNGTFYYYQAGFDPQFFNYSVGMLMLGLVIKQAIEEGHEEYDMLHGNEDYKYLWAQQKRELIRITQYPPHMTGITSQALMRIRSKIKAVLGPLRPGRLHS